MYRVEGRGPATILDVAYFTHEIEDKGSHDDSSYMAAVEGVADKERDMKHVEFSQQAVEQQKKILQQFASHITNLDNEVCYAPITC